MLCAFCRRELVYIHGHAACVTSGCPMYGVNQAECCDGETAEAAPVRTAEIAAVPGVIAAGGPGAIHAAPPPRRAFSVAVYPRLDDKVLIIHHKRLGVWLPPGGEMLAGETPLEAATRELFEETGLHGRFPRTSDIDGVPPGLIGYEEHPAGSKGQHLNFVFVCDVDSAEVRPNDEFTRWQWVTFAEGPWGESPPNVGQLAKVALAAPRARAAARSTESASPGFRAR